MSDLKVTKNCEFCDIEFSAIRQTAKFCSNSCRTKANVQRRENEKIETQKAENQAVIEQSKRAVAEARKFKKAEKEAELTKAKRLAEIEIEIQAEIDAFESAEKNRIINSLIEKLRVKIEAREKQLQEEEGCKKAEEKFIRDKKLRDDGIRAEMIGKGIAEMLNSFSNRNKLSENALTKPDPNYPSHLLKKPGRSLLPIAPTVKINNIKPVNLMTLEGIDELSISVNEKMKPPMKQTIPAPPANNQGHKSIVDNILDMTIFF